MHGAVVSKTGSGGRGGGLAGGVGLGMSDSSMGLAFESLKDIEGRHVGW